MSLPVDVQARFAQVASGLDAGLQDGVHTIPSAMAVDPIAYDHGWVESELLRAKIGAILDDVVDGTRSVGIVGRGRGSREVVIDHEGVRRLFRVKRATRDRYGDLKVLASSDSVLTRPTVPPRPDPDLFGLVEEIHTCEQWIMAYEVAHDPIRLETITLARPIGFVSGMPGRLRLANEIPMTLYTPPPPRFDPGDEEDLFGDGYGEQSGEF